MKRATFQSERLGSPPSKPILTKEINGTTYYLFAWPDRSVRLVAARLVKQEGETKTWKSREFNLPSLDALLQQPILPPDLIPLIKDLTNK